MPTLTPEPPVASSAPAGSLRRESIATVTAHDAVLDCDYTFTVCKVTERTGQWRVCVQSARSTGTVFTSALLDRCLRRVDPQRQEWFQWDYSLDPQAGFSRTVQFRVHVQHGRTQAIELFFPTRTLEGTIDTDHAITFPFPA